MTFKALLIDEDERSAEDLASLVEGGRLGFDVTISRSEVDAIQSLGSASYDLLIAAVGNDSKAAVRTLEHAAQTCPGVARLGIGTDHVQLGGTTNHLVRRPLDAEKLRRAMLAATLLGDRISSERLDSLLMGTLRMPALPTVYIKLQDLLRGSDPSLQQVGEIIRTDPAVSVKVIQTVNSALFGLRTTVADVAQAAVLLGIDRVSNLVLAVAVFEQASKLDIRLIESMWKEALEVSSLAGAIAKHEGLGAAAVEAAKLGGLLHDIGAIVLFQNWRDDYLSIDPTDEAERSLFGVSHSDIGGFLCAMWKLPREVVDVVLHHHVPPVSDVVDPVTAVHVAKALVSAGHTAADALIHPVVLEKVATADRLQLWASLAA